MPAIHLMIKGKVQGVFFRASAKALAEKIGIKGWVKNTSDGNVEMIVSGSEDELQKFVDWCRIGPENAKVASVEKSDVPDENFTQFKIQKNHFF